MYGNFLIHRGTIRASPSFPPNRYLIEIGGPNCKDICTENVGIEDLMLDAQHYALGGLYLNATMGSYLKSEGEILLKGN